MTVAAAAGYIGLGMMLGIMYAERMWWLLSRPLPCLWRPLAAAYEAAWAGLMPCGQADDTDPWG